jgi:rubrerythrin
MKKETIGYIKQAIISEIEGYEFYKMAAAKAREPFVKETYLELADEERKHVEWLQKLLVEMGDEDNRLDLETVDAPPSPEFFKWEKLDRENPQTTISVFGIAMQLEKSSYEFYGKAAETMEDETSKKLFKILEAWERAHYDMFLKEYKLLQEEWWSEQNFAPY